MAVYHALIVVTFYTELKSTFRVQKMKTFSAGASFASGINFNLFNRKTPSTVSRVFFVS